MACSLVHPDTKYAVWELAYKYADLIIEAQESNEKWAQKKIEAMLAEIVSHGGEEPQVEEQGEIAPLPTSKTASNDPA